MRNLNLVLLTKCSLIFLLVISCKTQSTPKIDCPIVIGPRGAQLLISFESAKELCQNRIKYVSIEQMSESQYTARDSYQNVYESTKSDSMILVSKASSKYYSGPEGGINFLMFKGIGENSYWLGLEEYNGKYYTLKEDSILQIIGFSEKKYRDTPEGSKILMTKGYGQKDYYTGSSYGKIYKEKGESDVEQIGSFSSFWLPASEESILQRAIIMTKGMGEKDKWCGELDGVIYIQK